MDHSDSESEGPETGSDGEWSGDDDPLSDHGKTNVHVARDDLIRSWDQRPTSDLQSRRTHKVIKTTYNKVYRTTIMFLSALQQGLHSYD